jgi:hypothetical protein
MRHAFIKALEEWKDRGNKPLSYYLVESRLNRHSRKPRRRRSRK